MNVNLIYYMFVRERKKRIGVATSQLRLWTSNKVI